ncbi:hypothetical protein L6452_22199 [Arctium lappa]|uniref:Uncharacterized protein n=1 Tax=Arctium lappa TaxID=4217 RepID=A0ACB9B0E3_ARCLA|nr:hypothetical protein L6452_22199 [Arctium lappa]
MLRPEDPYSAERDKTGSPLFGRRDKTGDTLFGRRGLTGAQVSELEAKPIEGKIYVPPLVLESKISELENTLTEERILMDLEQTVFSTVFKTTNFPKFSKALNSDDKSSSLENDLNFLHSDGILNDCVVQFDFTSKLPDHSSCVVNSFRLPSVFEKDLRKQRVGVKTAWIPKQKIDEKAKSSSSFILNKKTSSKDDVIVNVATFKSNLVDSRKMYSIKQLFQLAPSNKKFLNYGECDYASRKYSDTRHMWYLDSGCSKHMTGQKSMLSNFTDKYCGTVRFGNDQFSPILGYGDVVHENLTIKKVSYVEGLGHNLFSIGQFCDKHLEVNFKAKTCSVRTEEGKELLVGTRKSNLYTINLSKVQADNQLVSGKLVKGLPELKYEREHLCAACEKGKMKRFTHKPKPEPSTNSPLELLHMDLCGPMRTQSLGGKKYVLVIVDDYTRYTWVKFLRSKDETPEVLITFLKMTQVNLQKQVKILRTDNGTEFKNKIVEEYLKSVGISHQYSAARMPQQNGVEGEQY